MQDQHSQNNIPPENPSNLVDISDNEELNYQINTTTQGDILLNSNNNYDNNNLSNNNKSSPLKPSYHLQSPYQKPSTPLRDNSSNSKLQYEKLLQEKNALMESLRKEMILNEEHRNYIQILKETLESNLLKCGISNQLKSSTQSPNINQSEITDFVINYHKFQNENEKLKEDLTQMNNILNELKNENETLKSKLEACNAENILIKEHIEKLKSTNFEQTEQNSKNDQDIQTLTINLNSLRNQNALLQNQINELQSMQLTKDKQVQSSYNQLDMMNADLTKYRSLENNYNRLVSDYEQIKYDLFTNQKEKQSLESEISLLKNDISNLNSNLNTLHNENQKLLSDYDKLKTQYEEVLVEKKTAEKLNETFHYRKKELDESYDKISSLQLKNNELLAINDKNEQMLNDYLSNISELKRLNDKLQYDYNKVLDELNSNKDAFIENTNENKTLHLKLKELTEEHNALLLLHHEHENEVNKLLAQKASCENEIRYWKDRYERDLFKKEQQCKNLNDECKHGKDDIRKLINELEKVKKLNNDFNIKLQNKCDNEQRLIKERDKYKSSYMNINTKYNSIKSEIQNEIDNSKRLEQSNNELENKLNNLTLHSNTEHHNKMEIATKLNDMINQNKQLNTQVNASINNIKCNPSSQVVLSDKMQIYLNKSKPLIPSNSTSNSQVEEYINVSSQEIQNLSDQLFKAKKQLGALNEKVVDCENEKNKYLQNNDAYIKKYNDVNIEYTRLSQDNYNLLTEINNLKSIIQQLKDSCNNFSLELNNKDKMIDHLNYELQLSEDHKDKANTNAAFVETVLLRVCKMFPNTNLYKIVHDINDRFLNDKDKEELNHQLLVELKRAEDYLKGIKDKAIEVGYINKHLTRQIEEANDVIRAGKYGKMMLNESTTGYGSGSGRWSDLNGSGNDYSFPQREGINEGFK